MANFHTLVVLVENTSGVLARVSGLFARRGFNIESLAVAPTEDSSLSRFTIVVDAESVSMDQIKKQLDKLINVVEISELLPSESVEQELVMIKLGFNALSSNGVPSSIQELIEKYSIRILAESKGGEKSGAGGENESRLILSMTGLHKEVEELENTLEEMEGFEILEIQRTGKIAISN